MFKGSNTTMLGAAAPGAALVVLATWTIFKVFEVDMTQSDLDLLTTVAKWGAGGSLGGAGANAVRHLGEGWRKPGAAPAPSEGAP